MSSPKGFPSALKEARTAANFSTVEPVHEEQNALSVLTHQFMREVDPLVTIEANSTQTNLVVTGHQALRGDVVNFTSGALDGKEVKVWSTSANEIILAEKLTVAPAPGDTFQLLRHKAPRVDDDGFFITTSGPIQFRRDMLPTYVDEDTVDPANNVPLPVKLTGVTGDINITANDLHVQLSHSAANPDSTQIGDGTEILQITAAGEALVKDQDVLAMLTDIEAGIPEALGQGTMAQSMPVVLADDHSVINVKLPDALTQTSTASLAALGAYLQLETNGASQFCFKPAGTWDGLLSLSGSTLDSADPGFDSSFQLIPIYDYVSQTVQNFCGGNTTHTGQVGGFRYLRVSMAVYNSGTANVSAWLNAGDGPSVVTSPAPGGFYVTANLRDGDGTKVVIGQKTMAASLPVVLPSNQWVQVGLHDGDDLPVTMGRKNQAESLPVTVSLDDDLATASNQSAGNVLLSAINTKLGNTLTVAQTAPTAKTVKSAAVTVGTTAVRATTDGAAVTAGRVKLIIRPSDGNSGDIYIGPSGVTTATGFKLYPGESFELSNDAGEYYLVASLAAQTAFILEQE